MFLYDFDDYDYGIEDQNRKGKIKNQYTLTDKWWDYL